MFTSANKATRRSASLTKTSLSTALVNRRTATPMEATPEAISPKLVSRTVSLGAKPPVVEFPTSPDPVEQDIIVHCSHPQHRLLHVSVPRLFVCMGCKEYGAGGKFTCQQCNFELHEFCALAPPVIKSHSLHSQHHLFLNPKPGKGGIMKSKCDVCGKSTRGYVYQCSACSFQIHPCCALLSPKVTFRVHPHPLILVPASVSSGDPAGSVCPECKKQRRSGQVYRCTMCEYYMHAVCAKSMVNGLNANGIRWRPKEKPSVLEVVGNIASHVVAGFVGGLIEGIGEGLGEALTQNVVKAPPNSRGSSPSRLINR